MNTNLAIGAVSGLLAGAAVVAGVLYLQNTPPAPASPAAVAGAATPAAAAPPGALAAPAASANPGAAPIIIVVDRNSILRDSTVGKDLRAQIDTLGKAAEAKFRDEEKKLRDDMRELQEQAAALSADARQRREQELRGRAEDLQRKVQEEQAAIQGGIDKARSEIEAALGPILQAIFAERGATVLLDRGAIVLGSVDIDITAIVIDRLDKTLASVKVEPVKPEQAPQPQGGGGQ